MPSRFSTNDIKRKFYYFFTFLVCNFGWHYWRCHWSDEFHGTFLVFYLHTIHIFPHSFWTLKFFQFIQNLLIEKVGIKNLLEILLHKYIYFAFTYSMFFLLLKSWWYKKTILRKTDIQIYVGYDKRFYGISFFVCVLNFSWWKMKNLKHSGVIIIFAFQLKQWCEFYQIDLELFQFSIRNHEFIVQVLYLTVIFLAEWL